MFLEVFMQKRFFYAISLFMTVFFISSIISCSDLDTSSTNNENVKAKELPLLIETSVNTEELTNKEVIIEVIVTGYSTAGYVYSKNKISWESADEVFENKNYCSFGGIMNSYTSIINDKFTTGICASANGYYTIAVKGNDGKTSIYKEVYISNIDKDSTADIRDLTVEYVYKTKSIFLTWENPTDEDFSYISLSYTKGGTPIISDEHIIDSSYTIENVEIDGDEYTFSLCAVDNVGNKTKILTEKVIPTDKAFVTKILLSRYHFAYNDPNQTLTAVAYLGNIECLSENTIIKIQTKDTSGSITNSVATVDKGTRTATATITAPVTPPSSNGMTYTVLCKIDDDMVDSVHTARFNVSSTANLSGVTQSYDASAFSTDKIQISLRNVTSSSTEIVRIDGYNLDLTTPQIQIYDSTGKAYFEKPICVDISSVVWTQTTGSNYQTIDTEIPIPPVDDFYTIGVLFDEYLQYDTLDFQIYDTPKFTSFTIPLVSISKENSIVTAAIKGKNFDTPDVDFSNFNATCSTKPSIVANTSFTKKSDSILSVSFIIPGTVGEYPIKISYGSENIEGTLKAKDFSQYSVGDVLLNDGTIVSYNADNLIFTDEQKGKVVGVLFLNEYDAPAGWVGINQNYQWYQWAKNASIVDNIEFSDIICLPSTEGFQAAQTATFTGDIDGSDNWEYIRSVDPYGTKNAEVNYPAYYYVNSYAEIFGLTGTYAAGWYMPTIAELCYIYLNRETINKVTYALRKETVFRDYLTGYWSSSQSKSKCYSVWKLGNGGLLLEYPKSNGDLLILCIRAFE